jgi:hypothetical protein
VQPFAAAGASCTVMNAEAEEYELARRARGGDREALTELVARTRLRLFALAYAELRHYYSTKVITPKDLPGLPKALKGHSFAALDECILGRSALEVLIHLRANPESAESTVCLLCSHPTEFMASAYFSAGLDRLVCKEDPSDIAHLAQPATSSASMWRSFTGRARNTIIFASASLQSPYKSHTVLLHSFRTINLCSPPERCRGRPRPSSAHVVHQPLTPALVHEREVCHRLSASQVMKLSLQSLIISASPIFSRAVHTIVGARRARLVRRSHAGVTEALDGEPLR